MKSEIIQFNQHVILPPDAFGAMDSALVSQYAAQAASLIEKLGGEHMFHPSGTTLQAYMLHGLATCALENGQVSGFIKLDPWVKYLHGKPANMGEHGAEVVLNHIDQGLAYAVGMESGSLVVSQSDQNKGLGTVLKKTLSEHALRTFSNLPLFSVVTNDNSPSLHVNHKLGWIPITPQQSLTLLQEVDVLDGWEPPSTIFVHPDSLRWYHWDKMGIEPPQGSHAWNIAQSSLYGRCVE